MVKKKLSVLAVCLLVLFLFYEILIVFPPVENRRNAVRGDALVDTSASDENENSLDGKEFEIGTTLAVPGGVIAVDGKDYPAESIVYFPDGYATARTEITLEQVGQYTVEYRAEVNSRFHSRYEEFYVYDKMFSLSGLGSYAAYEPSEYAPDTPGIKCELSNGSKFTYNKIINLNELNGKPFFSAFFTPQIIGEMDALTFYVQLTDARDPSNYVLVKANASREGLWHGVAYLQAGAANQTPTGVEWNMDKVHSNNQFGFPADVSFQGVSSVGQPIEGNRLELYFDTETNQVLSAANRYGDSIIIDLDDPQYFSELFEGFTNGEVLLSLWAEDMQTSLFGIEIVEIAGFDLAEDKLTDKDPPVISVDMEGYDAVPNAITGNPYVVFAATAYDSYSAEVDVNARVYYNFGSATSKTEVDLQNGCFIPKRAGVYTIEYTAADSWGNTGYATVEVEAVEKAQEEIFLNLETEGRVLEGTVGKELPVSKAVFGGGIGTEELTVTAEKGNEVFPITDYAFIPMGEGEYTIRYEVRDRANQTAEKTYSVNITAGKDPVFLDTPKLPRYFVAETLYELPELFAYDFTSGEKQPVKTTITIKDDGGERILTDSRKTYFNVSGARSVVTITYKAVTAGGSDSVSYTVPVINNKDEVGDIALENFFDTNNIDQVEAEKDRIVFSMDKNSDFTFINPLLADEFSYNFSVDTANRNLEAIHLYLQDSETGTEIKLSIFKEGTGSYFTVNDGAVHYGIENSFTDSAKSSFELKYDALNQRISLENTKYVSVKTDYAGNPFTGFESGKIYLRTEVVTSGKAAVSVEFINDQPINSVAIDRVAPKIFIEGSYGGSAKLGETVSLNRAYAVDVIDPAPSLTFSVRDPDGNFLISTDGVRLENVVPTGNERVVLDKYGMYTVEYSAKDAGGRNRSFSYVIWVDDAEAPVITLQEKMVETCEVGDAVVIPKVTVSDNITSAENIVVSVSVQLPTGRVITIPKESNSFRADYEGEYVVRIVAYDEMGNQSAVVMKVTAAKRSS